MVPHGSCRAKELILKTQTKNQSTSISSASTPNLELVLDQEMANAVVRQVFEGLRQPDDLYKQACALLGLDPGRIKYLQQEARLVTRGRNRFYILTPTGSGRCR